MISSQQTRLDNLHRQVFGFGDKTRPSSSWVTGSTDSGRTPQPPPPQPRNRQQSRPGSAKPFSTTRAIVTTRDANTATSAAIYGSRYQQQPARPPKAPKQRPQSAYRRDRVAQRAKQIRVDSAATGGLTNGRKRLTFTSEPHSGKRQRHSPQQPQQLRQREDDEINVERHYTPLHISARLSPVSPGLEDTPPISRSTPSPSFDMCLSVAALEAVASRKSVSSPALCAEDATCGNRFYTGLAHSPSSFVETCNTPTEHMMVPPLSVENISDAYTQGNHSSFHSAIGGAAAASTGVPQDSTLAGTSEPPPAKRAKSFVDRLYNHEAVVGSTTIGRRLLSWATAAGVRLTPSSTSALRVCSLFGVNPVKYQRDWQRLCARSRRRMGRLEACVLLGKTGTAVNSITSRCASLDVSGGGGDSALNTRSRRYNDPEGGGRNKRDTSSSRKSFRVELSRGLCAFRQRRAYARWCHWQLHHFFGQGSSYLTSVWRHRDAPIGASASVRTSSCMDDPAARTTIRTTVAAAAASTTAEDLLCGRYVLPCEDRIEECVGEYRRDMRKQAFFNRLILEEVGLAETAESQSEAAEGDEDTGLADGTMLSDDSGRGEDGENVSTERSRNRLASTQPYIDVSFDARSGWLKLSVYVGGDEGGEGATFLRGCSAACLDNHRWLILEGLWKGQVLFFVPLMSDGSASDTATGVPQSASGRSFKNRPFVLAISSLFINGMGFEKLIPREVSSAPSDPFVCTRCGNIRRNNTLCISRRTGALTRGRYFCWVCRRRCAHVKMPPYFATEIARARKEAMSLKVSHAASNATAPASRPSPPPPKPTGTEVAGIQRSSASHFSKPSGAIQVVRMRRQPIVRRTDALSARYQSAHRPQWNSTMKLEHEQLLGSTRHLDTPPLKPKTPLVATK